jgi:hypothetical protein
MKKTVRAATLAVPFVLATGLASANEPMQLSERQLDGVTAGAGAFASAEAVALGRLQAAAFTETVTSTEPVPPDVVSQLTTIPVTGSVPQSFIRSVAESRSVATAGAAAGGFAFGQAVGTRGTFTESNTFASVNSFLQVAVGSASNLSTAQSAPVPGVGSIAFATSASNSAAALP